MLQSLSSDDIGHFTQEVKKIDLATRKNLSNIFESLILSLDLRDNSEKSKYLLFGKQHPPFSFSVDDALNKLSNLRLDIEVKVARTTITYSMKQGLAFDLLKQFFEAKLIHYPNSRTETKLERHGILQITPKGTAMVCAFCQSIGMPSKAIPSVVKSAFNSMELFNLERSSVNQNILCSEYLVKMLFSWVMGPVPNVWSVDRQPDPISCVYYETGSDGEYDFFSADEHRSQNGDGSTKESVISPFHHRYFTNPESDSHVQYYVSNTGVRLFKQKVFLNNDKKVVVDYCVSGKAIVQWLCDCTSVRNAAEAVSIGDLFIERGLLRQITVDKQRFLNDRNAFYILTEQGSVACKWSAKTKRKNLTNNFPLLDIHPSGFSTGQFDGPTLKDIIKDPGLRILFKMHMQKERCVENVDAYILLVNFGDLVQQVFKLHKYYQALEDGPRKSKVFNAISFHMNSFFSKAFQLYSAYISADLQFDLNIDYKLRQDAHRLLTFDGPLLPTIDHMMTPMTDKLFFGDQDLSQIAQPLTPPVDANHVIIESDLVKNVALVRDIHRVFLKIADSIFRLMEIDSYPKFIKSDAFLDTVAHV